MSDPRTAQEVLQQLVTEKQFETLKTAENLAAELPLLLKEFQRNLREALVEHNRTFTDVERQTATRITAWIDKMIESSEASHAASDRLRNELAGTLLGGNRIVLELSEVLLRREKEWADQNARMMTLFQSASEGIHSTLTEHRSRGGLSASRWKGLLVAILVVACINPFADRLLFWVWPAQPADSPAAVSTVSVVPTIDRPIRP